MSGLVGGLLVSEDRSYIIAHEVVIIIIHVHVFPHKDTVTFKHLGHSKKLS